MSKKEIPLSTLSLEQLSSIGKQIEQDIQSLSGSYTSLKVVMTKFKENKDYIKSLQSSKDKEMLIPMTQSVFIPGKISDISHFTIELGGNYFVRTNVKNSEAFCDRKIKLLNENMDKIDNLIIEKNKIMNEINSNIITKNQELIEQQNKVKSGN